MQKVKESIMSNRRAHFLRQYPTVIAALASCAIVVGYAQPSSTPDAIYVNATVITMDASSRTVEAVAVKGDKISAVGSNTDIRRAAGSSTRVLDLKGKVLLPGFVDAHSHFPGNGVDALYVVNLGSPPVGPINSIDDLVAALKKKAANTPKGEWIRGSGYDQTLLKEGRHPTRADLDRASTDHPIYISHASGHLGVANSFALKIAEVTKNTPQPPGGVIQKDPKTGEPNGVFEESGGMVARHAPRYTPEQMREAIKWAVKDYAEHGVTTATLAGGGINDGLKAASRDGVLPLRVVAMLAWNPKLPKAALIGNEMLKTGLTVGEDVHDGSIQGYTGYLTKPYYVPYHGDAAYRGYPRETREQLIAYVKEANRLGYQLAIHANGDEAIEDVIVAYREALRDTPRQDTRFRIEHAQMTREDQLDEMKELGISPSFFVSHTYYWGDQHRDIFMGPERAARMSPLRSAIRRGIRFSIHLDTPVTPMSPLQAVWSAVNRLSRSGKVIGPDQRITPLEALRAVTIDAAWQEHDEKLKGSIEAGKFADLIVLAENPLTVNPVHIKDIQVLETIVGGKTVFTREATQTTPQQ
jgi:predicted amidohydrolase YtcJ